MRRVAAFAAPEDGDIVSPCAGFLAQVGDGVKDRDVHALALFGGLDNLRGEAVFVDFADFRAGGDDGVKVGNAKLDGFFNQEIHAVFFDGGEKEVSRWALARLLADKVFDCQPAVFFAEIGDFSQPFAAMTVEKTQGIARATAQHIAQVMRGGFLQRDHCIGGKIALNIDAWKFCKIIIHGYLQVNTKNHTDIKMEGWIGRYSPAFLRPYILLMRLDRPIGIWLLLLSGWWAIVLSAGGIAAMTGREWGIFALFGVGAVVMRGAGCVINDLWDRDLDRQVERTRLRPLAYGAVSPRGAMVFLAGLLCCGLLILLQMNFVTVLLGFISVPLIVAYPLMKRVTWWPQAFLGLTFNFGALMGWSAVTGVVELPALLLYCGGIFWTLGYDTIYAHQDREDDMLAGIKSTALRLGARSKMWVTGFYAAAWICFALAAGASGFLFLIPAGLHLFWQITTWNPDGAESSLKIFRSNRDFGLLVLTSLLLS